MRLTAQLDDAVAGLLRDPGAVRVRGAGDELDSARRERDEEEDVDPLQPERLRDLLGELIHEYEAA